MSGKALTTKAFDPRLPERIAVARIGITSSIASDFVRDLLAAWQIEHPSVAIDLVEGAFDDHAAALHRHDLDLSFQLNSVSHQTLDAELLWIDRVFAAVPIGGKHAKLTTCSLAEFAAAHFVVSTRNSGLDIRDFLTIRLYRLGKSRSIRMIDVGCEALTHCVGLSMGVTITASSDTANHFPNVTVVEVLDERLPCSAIWSPRNDNPALRQILSMARIQAARERS